MTTIKLRRGSAEEWTEVNPVLAQGEPGFDTTTGVLKVGDGTTAWADLPGYLADTELRATFAARTRTGVAAVGQGELVVNVKDYGATGNGTDDDTEKVQAANSAAKGGVLYFPKGTYLVSAPIAAQSHTIYRGAGRTASTIKVAAGSGQSKVLDLSGCRDVIVEDLGLDGTGSGCIAGVYGSDNHSGKDWHVRRCLLTGFAPGSAPKNGQGAVYMWTANGVSVIDCVITASGRGIRLDTPSGDVVVRGNRITGGAGPVSADGVMLTGISINSSVQCDNARVSVTDNIVSGADRDPYYPNGREGHAIAVYKVANVRITGNHCLASGRGILCSAGSFGAVVQGNTVERNWDAGIRCEPAIDDDITVGGAGQRRGVVIVGNRCLGNSVVGASGSSANGTAITTSYAAGSTVVGNVVQDSGKHGIHCDSDRVVVVGNVVSNSWNGGASPLSGQGAKAGIGLYAAKDCIVAFNQCYDNQATRTQDYGLSVVTGDGGGPHVVFGNVLSGNGRGEIHDPQALVRNGFFGASPAARPAALPATDAGTVDESYGAEEAAVINNLRTRLEALESRLRDIGLLG
ncbi:glycosyl hydrolase family 28-related protein [Nocardioides cheoyonin]|uniref:glycosyl hydrolase family 28-related protein n=1 Tax=Nocardioides cheoyonin TaxID=3156615 RepID=UPI0032B3D323